MELDKDYEEYRRKRRQRLDQILESGDRDALIEFDEEYDCEFQRLKRAEEKGQNFPLK